MSHARFFSRLFCQVAVGLANGNSSDVLPRLWLITWGVTGWLQIRYQRRPPTLDLQQYKTGFRFTLLVAFVYLEFYTHALNKRLKAPTAVGAT